MSLQALIRFTLNVGLMKPRRGLTLVAGKEKLGKGQVDKALLHDLVPLPIFGIILERSDRLVLWVEIWKGQQELRERKHA